MKVMMALWALAGLGLLVPTAVYGLPEGGLVDSAVLEAASATRMCGAIAEPLVRLETRLEQAEGPLRWEDTFVGHANERIVVYRETFEASPLERLELYDPDGLRVSSRYYPYDLELSESDGQHWRFDLTKTGEYRLVFTVDPGDLLGADAPFPSAPLPVFRWPLEKLAYFLRVRVASYYERLVFQADEFSRDNRPEAALSLYSRAIDRCPNRPEPYMRRLRAYGGIAYGSISVADGLAPTDFITQLFQALDANSQAVVLSDLRRAAQNYHEIVESGADSFGEFEYQLLDELADFLETGTVSERLMEGIRELEEE